VVTVVVVWSLGMLVAAATEAIWAEVPHPIPASAQDPILAHLFIRPRLY
jgi:hypothetical protein